MVRKIPKHLFKTFTFIFDDIFAPIMAPTTPLIANVIPIFHSINLDLIETIIADIDVGTKNTKFVA